MAFPLQLICFLLAALPVTEEAGVPVVYSIPLPERTYSGEWEATLEFRSAKKGELSFDLLGLDSNGKRILDFPDQILGLDRIYQFNLPARKKETVQSLSLVCSGQVVGMLWVHHPGSGQLMGLPLQTASEVPLMVVHLPKNYLVWKSSLSLQGSAGTERSASVILSYFTETHFQPREELIATTLSDLAYLRRTPNVDILIGGLSSPAPPLWGSVKASPGFSLAGYQTFARQDGLVQTAGLEMPAVLHHSGIFLWDLGLDGVRQSLAFANPHQQELVLELTAILAAQSADLEQPTSRYLTTVLGLEQGRNLLLNIEELFEISSDYSVLAVEYRVISALEEEPLPVMASRFAMGAQDLGMAADTASTTKTELVGWISFDDSFEKEFRAANLADQTTQVEWRISSSDQLSLLGFQTLQPGQVLHFDRLELQRRAAELGWQMEASAGWALIQLRQESVTINDPLVPALLGQQIGKTATDFALIACPR
jgi:hypothetical protein